MVSFTALQPLQCLFNLELKLTLADFDRYRLRSHKFRLLARWTKLPSRIRGQGGRKRRDLDWYPMQRRGRACRGEGHYQQAAETRKPTSVLQRSIDIWAQYVTRSKGTTIQANFYSGIIRSRSRRKTFHLPCTRGSRDLAESLQDPHLN